MDINISFVIIIILVIAIDAENCPQIHWAMSASRFTKCTYVPTDGIETKILLHMNSI